MSSHADVPPQPRWVRRVQICALIVEFAALALMWCHMAFGLWPHSVAYAVLVVVLQAAFAAMQLIVLRYFRRQRGAR